MEPNRFDLVQGSDTRDTTVYSASHEIWNTVDIHFPPGYWHGVKGGPPPYIEMVFQFTGPKEIM